MHQQIRQALRTLRRTPGYTTVALITLVLGIGANTAVFSIVRGVLLAALPFPEPDRLVRVWEVNESNNEMQAAWRNFTDWREAATQFAGLVANSPAREATVLGAGEALRVRVSRVSTGFFHTLGTGAVLGRTFMADEHRSGAAAAVVISDRFWRTYFGARNDLHTQRLTIDGHDAQVIGVVARSAAYPLDADVWLPIELSEQSDARTAHNYEVLGRLRDGARIDGARRELDAITKRFAEELGTDAGASLGDYFPVATRVRTLHDELVGDIARALWILLGAALLVLVVACTNLAGTGLARGASREREYAIRHALGAGRSRLVGVALTETLILAGLGAAAGIAGAALAIRVLPVAAPAGIPRLDDVRLDATVLAFTIVLSLLAALAAGALPGLRIATSAMRSLRSGGRAGDEPGRARIWKVLIAAEMALALVLLTGAGLLLRSFQSVLDVEPGFHPSGVLTATLNPPPSKYADPESRRRYYDAALDQLRAVPGVGGVGIIAVPPLASPGNGLLAIEHGPRSDITGDYQLADDGYFDVMGIPLLAGRLFDGRDHENAEHVVVINRAFANAAWPGEDPIGRRITGGGMDNFWNRLTWAQVIGVVGDVRQRDLTQPPQPAAYFSYRQRPFRSWSMTAVLAPSGTAAPVGLVPGVRATLRTLDSDVPVSFATIDERISTTLAARRFVTLVIALFAGIALVLAAVGVYGVVAYSVERRRREIGIRLALGAQPGHVRMQVQRDYMLAGAIGAVVGVALAAVLTRLMTSLLFGVEPADPATFGIVVASLGFTLWLASYIPSLQSTRVDPLESMRSD
jgi:putative ABC transport system permease protein